MSLHPQAFCAVPEETVRVARAAYPKGNVYLQVRDELGTIYTDQSFAELFPNCGQPAEAPWRLLLVSLMQFAEGLSDRQAADAVRGRLDWKYLLSLDLTDPGFDASVLCEFRARLLEGQTEQQIVQPLLDIARKHGWLKERGKQRTDSTHVFGAIRTLNRLETVGETMRATLNDMRAERQGRGCYMTFNGSDTHESLPARTPKPGYRCKPISGVPPIPLMCTHG